MTQSRKVHAWVPIIPRTVNVTYEGQMSNDTSVLPVALLENAVTRPIAYQARKYAVHLSDEVPISNELFVFDL